MEKGKGVQEEIFSASEGDRWIGRNRAALADPRRAAADPVLEMIRRQGLKPRRVLEIGCSNGWRLGVLARRGIACVGVEPSAAAIREGRRLHPGVEFRRGTAAALPLKVGETFDLVIVSFVLHWVSRERLWRSAAEIDRALAEGGRLLVADFLPTEPRRVPYHHVKSPKLYTYKLDYPALFAASGLYREEARRVFHHATLRAARRIPPGDRAVCALLRKSVGHYRALSGGRR